MAEDIYKVLEDKDFHLLPIGQRLTMLRDNYPEFAALSPKDQGTVISKANQKVLGQGTGDRNTPDPGFLKTLGKDIWNMPGALAGTAQRALHQAPTETAKDLWRPQQEQFSKAGQAFKEGSYLEAFGHGVAGALPILGPFAAQVGEELGGGQYGAAGAHALELAGPELLKKLPRGPKFTRTVENVNNPVTERALQSVQGEIRMTPGQRAGQQALQTSERDLLNKPGTSTEAHEFYAGQQEDLAKAGQARTARQPGQVTNPYGAGQGVIETAETRVQDLKKYADKLYDSTRQTTARNVQQVQTGTKTVPGPNPAATLHPSGMPRTVPVIQGLESPVALAPIKTQLRAVYDELKRTIPPAQQQYSPAWGALENLMTSDVTQMNALDFDKFLGALKHISRNGETPLLSTQSQRLARQVIAAGEQEFQRAISGAGPNVARKLGNARKAVAEYHDTADFIGQLRSEPGALYQNLTTGGDRVKNTIDHLDRIAPKAIDTVGRTYLGEMMDKATREGGFGRSAGVKADWERMGPETKKLIFGAKLTQDMDDFLLAAKKLTPAVGSPTADRLSALSSYGDVGVAVAEFLGGAAVGHPGLGTLAAGGTLLRTRVQPAILAKLTFKPMGAQLLKQAITVPINSPRFNQTMRMLNAMAQDQENSPGGVALAR